MSEPALIEVLARRIAHLEHCLNWLAKYEKQPPEVVKDDFAYDRFLAYVHETAATGLRECECGKMDRRLAAITKAARRSAGGHTASEGAGRAAQSAAAGTTVIDPPPVGVRTDSSPALPTPPMTPEEKT